MNGLFVRGRRVWVVTVSLVARAVEVVRVQRVVDGFCDLVAQAVEVVQT